MTAAGSPERREDEVRADLGLLGRRVCFSHLEKGRLGGSRPKRDMVWSTWPQESRG